MYTPIQKLEVYTNISQGHEIFLYTSNFVYTPYIFIPPPNFVYTPYISIPATNIGVYTEIYTPNFVYTPLQGKFLYFSGSI